MIKTVEGPQYKKGDVFECEGAWCVAEADSAYQNAAYVEEAFDTFLPHNGFYTACREATSEEIQAHMDKLAAIRAAELANAGRFQIGQRVRRKKSATGRMATVLDVDHENASIKCVFDGAKAGAWDAARAFEMVEAQ